MKYIGILLQNKQSVFSLQELWFLWNIEKIWYLRLLVHRMKKQWLLLHVGPWLYALPDYDQFELASKIYSPSYISFETVLQSAGVIFQDYSKTITLATNNRRTKYIGGISYEYHKLKDSIFTNPLWIINKDNLYQIASAERAICDSIYLYKNNYFDNTSGLDKELLKELKHLYPKTTTLLVDQLIKKL